MDKYIDIDKVYVHPDFIDDEYEVLSKKPKLSEYDEANNIGNGGMTVGDIDRELVVDINDPKDLKRALNILGRDDQVKHTEADRFRRYYLDNYTEAESYRKLMEIFIG